MTATTQYATYTSLLRLPREGVPVEPVMEFAQLPLRFGDQVQWRYELIRPLLDFIHFPRMEKPCDISA
jgi:hypothetical protein